MTRYGILLLFPKRDLGTGCFIGKENGIRGRDDGSSGCGVLTGYGILLLRRKRDSSKSWHGNGIEKENGTRDRDDRSLGSGGFAVI